MLREKINAPATRLTKPAPATENHRPSMVKRVIDQATGKAKREAGYRHLRAQLHAKLLDDVDLDAMSKLPEAEVRSGLRRLTEQIIAESGSVINANERASLALDIEYEVLGLGPIEPLLADETVSDILINGPDQVYVERSGVLEETDVRFDGTDHLMRIIDRIVSKVGRRIDESNPMVDARLADGSRVNAVIAPLALNGPMVSIRRFGGAPLTADALIKNGTINESMAELLAGLVKAKLNVLISGGTGSGKTTLLNILSGHISNKERIVTIEDAAELVIQQPHVARLETRPESIEGKGAIGQRELVKNSLRMRPDRIIVGEVRGGEAFDMLQAMNTGHDGSMTTVHANTPRDALSRVENMVCMAGLDLPQRAIRQQIASAISVVVQIQRMSDGSRRLMNISEITGMEGDTVTMQDIFVFEQTGVDRKGRVQGELKATGIRPQFLSKLSAHGIAIPLAMFDPTRRVR